MITLEQEDIAFDTVQATMDRWESILLTIIRGLRAEPRPDEEAIGRTLVKLQAVSAERRALRVRDLAAVVIAQRRYSALIGHYERSREEPVEPMPNAALRLFDFEMARQTLGAMIAARSHWIGEERAKPEPDTARIETWLSERADFFRQDRALRWDDAAGIRRVIETFGPVVRAQGASQ